MRKLVLAIAVVAVLAVVGVALVRQWGDGALVVFGPPSGAVRVSVDGRDLGAVQPGAFRRYAVKLGSHVVKLDGPQQVEHAVTLDVNFAHLAVPALKEQCFAELTVHLTPDGRRVNAVSSRSRASVPWELARTIVLSERDLPRAVKEPRDITMLATLPCDALDGSVQAVLASLGRAPPPTTEPVPVPSPDPEPPRDTQPVPEAVPPAHEEPRPAPPAVTPEVSEPSPPEPAATDHPEPGLPAIAPTDADGG